MIDTMIKQMPKYESYKESGIEWLDEVPQTWQTSKLKYLASIFTGDSISPTLKDTYVSTELSGRAYIASKDIDVQTSRIDYENGVRIPFDRRHFKVAPEQSTLLCIEGGSAGKKIAYTAQDVCFVNKLACIASEKVLNKYLYYSLFSEPFQSQFKLSVVA